MSEEKTRGAASTGRTSEDFCRQKTWSALTARNGGNCAASIAGSPKTMTDIGLRKEGGLFSFKFICSPFGGASAGMYKYLAVCGFRRTLAQLMAATGE